MKRCPQCEFIYEDDQSLCDMDGVLLVLDSRTLPNLHTLAPVDVTTARRAYWRHRTFPAVAALILATVLSLVYFVTTQQAVHSPLPAADMLISPPVSNLPAQTEPTPAPSPTPDESSEAATATEQPKQEPAKAPASPAKKTSSKTTPTTQNRTEEPKKDDSKVNSILKKTGRILKKPFKF